MRIIAVHLRWTLVSWAALIGLYALSLAFFSTADQRQPAERIAAQTVPTPAVEASLRR